MGFFLWEGAYYGYIGISPVSLFLGVLCGLYRYGWMP